MTKLSEIITNVILKNAKWVLAIVLLVTIFFAWSASNIKIDYEFDIWFDKSDSTYLNYADFIDHFGDDRSLTIIYNSDSIFSDNELKVNREITQQLQELDGVEEVISLTSLRMPVYNLFQFTNTRLIPRRIKDYEKLEQRVCDLDILIDNIVSKDGKATAIHIIPVENTNHRELLDRTKECVLTFNNTERYFVIGGLPLFEETSRLSNEEPGFFMLLAFILMIGILLSIFRSIRISIIPISISILTIIWAMGLLELVGGSINMLTGIIPLILLVMSIAFSVHMISSFNKYYRKNPDPKTAIKNTFSEILVPGSIASLTTFFAISSFTFASIEPIRHFGFVTASGIAFSFILSVLLLPVIFNRKANIFSKTQNTFFSENAGFPGKITGFIIGNKRAIVIISGLVFLVSLYGISRLSFETDQIKYLRKTNEVRIAHDTASSYFNGIYPIELVFDISNIPKDSLGSKYQSFKTLEDRLLNNSRIEACHSYISMAQSVSKWNRNIVSSSRIFSEILDLEVKGAGKYLLQSYLSKSNSRFRFSVKTKWMNNQELLSMIDEINTTTEEIFPDNEIPFFITGTAPLLARLSDKLLRIQVNSLSFSFLIIFLILIIVFRKPKLFISGMIPNILPVITLLGIMGYFKVPMDVGTVLIASISLGIAIDDSVYYLSAFRSFNRENKSEEAILLSFRKIWRPLTITTVTLFSGFIVLMLSGYAPIMYMGLFVSLNILFALIYDFLLLPAILIYAYRKV